LFAVMQSLDQVRNEKRIVMTSEHQALLPDDIPDKWLERIRAVVRAEKPSFWQTVIASSLVATLIGVGFSYLANRDLENVKARLELQKDNVRSRVAAYSKLSQSLVKFADKVEGFANFVQIVNRTKPDNKSVEHIQHELSTVGQAEQDLDSARNDPVLNGSHAQQRVQECLSQLNPALADARRDPSASVPRLESAAAEMRNIATAIQGDISAEISGIR